jgi:hypothetical protein
VNFLFFFLSFTPLPCSPAPVPHQLTKGIHPKRSSSSFLLDTRPSYHQVRYSLYGLKFGVCWCDI